MSAGEASGWASSQSCSSPAWRRSARGSRADSGHGRAAGSGPGSADSGSGGACSRMTWALVPLMPNDDTPARRGRSTRGQGVGSGSRAAAPAFQSTWGEGRSVWRVRGSVPCRIAKIILMTPATPAAAWVCPMFDLSEPSSTGRPGGRFWP